MHTWGKDLIFRPHAEEKCTVSSHTEIILNLIYAACLRKNTPKKHITWFSPKPIWGSNFITPNPTSLQIDCCGEFQEWNLKKMSKSMLHFSYIQFSSFFRGLSGNILIIVICPVFDGKKTVRKPNHAVHMCWWVPATRVSHPAACRCGKWWAGPAEDRDGLESAQEKEGKGRLQALIHMGWNTVFFFKRGGITQQCS